jgi:hypothetical protein
MDSKKEIQHCLEEVELVHEEIKEAIHTEEVVATAKDVGNKAYCCCVKSWSSCLNICECICTGLSNICLLCSSCFLGCNKCLEQLDCDGK